MLRIFYTWPTYVQRFTGSVAVQIIYFNNNLNSNSTFFVSEVKRQPIPALAPLLQLNFNEECSRR